mgnify:CR=1 FL=1
MKVAEFKNMSKDELKSVLKKKTEELYELKVKNKLGQLANPLTIRVMKKDIARVLTVMSANKLNKSTEATKVAKTAKATKAPVKAKVTKEKVAKVKKAGASHAARK